MNNTLSPATPSTSTAASLGLLRNVNLNLNDTAYSSDEELSFLGKVEGTSDANAIIGDEELVLMEQEQQGQRPKLVCVEHFPTYENDDDDDDDDIPTVATGPTPKVKDPEISAFAAAVAVAAVQNPLKPKSSGVAFKNQKNLAIGGQGQIRQLAKAQMKLFQAFHYFVAGKHGECLEALLPIYKRNEIVVMIEQMDSIRSRYGWDLKLNYANFFSWLNLEFEDILDMEAEEKDVKVKGLADSALSVDPDRSPDVEVDSRVSAVEFDMLVDDHVNEHERENAEDPVRNMLGYLLLILDRPH